MDAIEEPFFEVDIFLKGLALTLNLQNLSSRFEGGHFKPDICVSSVF